MSDTALKTFIIYARNDKAYKDDLLRHLKPLTRSHQPKLTIWHDGEIALGEEWEKSLKEHLNESDLVLVLVTSHCLASDFIHTKELATAWEQVKAGTTRIIPIIVSACLWQEEPIFDSLQSLPTDAKAITTWANSEEAWTNVAQGIKGIIDLIHTERAAQQEKARLAELTAAKQERERVAAAEREAARLAKIAAEREQKEFLAAQKAAAKAKTPITPNLTKPFSTPIWVGGSIGILLVLVVLFMQIQTCNHNQDKRTKIVTDSIRKADSLSKLVATIPHDAPPKVNIDTIKQKSTDIKEVKPSTPTKDQPTSPKITTTPPKTPFKDPFEGQMVHIPAGTFKMGSNNGKENEKPIHKVKIKDFYAAKYEVTFAQYDIFCEAMKREKPNDEGWGRGNHPVIYVSWHDADAYCKWLATQTGKKYRLLTEEEWEYAAKGGQFDPSASSGESKLTGRDFEYAGSSNADEVAWHWGNSNSKTQPVGTKKGNGYGLYDKSYEWQCVGMDKQQVEGLRWRKSRCM